VSGKPPVSTGSPAKTPAKKAPPPPRTALKPKPAEGPKPKGVEGPKPKAAEEGAPVAEAAEKKRTWPKGGPSKADLKRYRDRLLEMRRALLSSSQELAAEALKSSGQEFSVDHMADHGSDNYEQDFSLKLLEGEAEQLAEIREALMKIDGRVELPFGLCEACSDEAQNLCPSCPWIPASRLDVLPHARLCVQTKEIEETKPS
jgi:DnaK suppressor protein